METRTVRGRDGFWLKHHEAQQASGKDAKEYASSVGISVQALYQARKRLRATSARATEVDDARKWVAMVEKSPKQSIAT